MPDRTLLLLAFSFLWITVGSSQQQDPNGLVSSTTGEIRGRVTIASGHSEAHSHAAMPGRYATHESMTAASSHSGEDPGLVKLAESFVVYLTGDDLDRGSYPPTAQMSGKKPVLDQKGMQFHPHVLPIMTGSTVDFPNRDNLFHNVFSYSQTKEFDLGRYPRDDSRSVTFDRPGVVRVYCDIHAQMNATILVLKNPFFVSPDDNGNYRLTNVPEGKHTLVFWYDRDVVGRVPVEVRAGHVIEQDFTH